MLPLLSLPLAVATAAALAVPVASPPPHPVLGPAPRAAGGVPGAAATGPGWMAPVEGPVRVLRPFAPPPRRWLPGHRGVDLAAGAGSPVLAAGAGTVLWAAPLAGRGVVVVGHADGRRTTYEPVDASVEEGDAVLAGDVLGVLGVGDVHCGGVPSCLHWGLRRGRDYLDPLLLLRRGRPVLLP